MSIITNKINILRLILTLNCRVKLRNCRAMCELPCARNVKIIRFGQTTDSEPPFDIHDLSYYAHIIINALTCLWEDNVIICLHALIVLRLPISFSHLLQTIIKVCTRAGVYRVFLTRTEGVYICMWASNAIIYPCML